MFLNSLYPLRTALRDNGTTPDQISLCEHEMCHYRFTSPGDPPDPCSDETPHHTTTTLRSKLRDLRRRRRNEEDKEVPQLKITAEPPTTLDVMSGSDATISCLAESQKTQNIGYSWEYTNDNRAVEVQLYIQYIQ